MTGYSNAVNDPRERAFFAEVKAEVAAQRPSAIVLSDGTGKWHHAFCQTCGWRGQAAKDRALIQARADQHNTEKHS